jgi:hypothetical protein
MNKILLVIFALMTIFLGIRLLRILVQDIDRLTNFGYGYLTAQVILFFVFLIASLWMGRKIFRQDREA